MIDLNRYKGKFIKGNPKEIKQPKENDIVYYDTRLEINNCSFSHNGWIPPKKGAL